MIFTLTLGMMAFVGALVFVLGLAVALHITALRKQGFISYFVPVVLFLGAVQTALASRDLSIPPEQNLVDPPIPAAFLLLGRLGSLFVLMASTERLVSFAVGGNAGDRNERTVSPVLLFSLLAMWMATVLSPALLGSVPGFSHQFIYPGLLGCAALTVSQREAVRSIELARNATLLFLLASVLVVPLLPFEHTIESPYLDGFLPGLPRFHGLASHAVTLGMLALLAVLLLATHPFRRRLLGFAAWALVLAMLFIAQSKTAWLALIVCGIGVGLARWGPHAANLISSRRNASVLLLILVVSMIGYVLIGGVLAFAEIGARLDAFFASDAGASISSLTGRDLVWRLALEEWHRNPIFGYGHTLFDRSYRISIDVPAAVHGHSQVIDTLARSGIVGITGLACYTIALTYYSFKYALASRGLTVGLYLLLLLRAITEVPLSFAEYSPEMIPHFVLLVTIAGLHGQRVRQASRSPSRQHAGLLSRTALG